VQTLDQICNVARTNDSSTPVLEVAHGNREQDITLRERLMSLLERLDRTGRFILDVEGCHLAIVPMENQVSFRRMYAYIPNLVQVELGLTCFPRT
jgi:hypothetical protein